MDIERQQNYEEELKGFEEAILNAQENYGDTEVREAIMNKADFFLRNGENEKAIKTYLLAYEKTVGVSKRLEIYMLLLQIYFKDKSLVDIKSYITKSKLLLEEGGDWENKNKLKVRTTSTGLRRTLLPHNQGFCYCRQAVRGRHVDFQFSGDHVIRRFDFLHSGGWTDDFATFRDKGKGRMTVKT